MSIKNILLAAALLAAGFYLGRKMPEWGGMSGISQGGTLAG